MELLSEILSHVTVSRSFTGAAFVTSSALVFGPNVLPKHIAPLPNEWLLPATAVFIFSGALLFFWFVAALWQTSTRKLAAVRLQRSARILSAKEEFLIRALAESPEYQINVGEFKQETSGLTRLEIIGVAEGLSDKGLAGLNMFDETLIFLTPEGRKRALELHRTKWSTVENDG